MARTWLANLTWALLHLDGVTLNFVIDDRQGSQESVRDSEHAEQRPQNVRANTMDTHISFRHGAQITAHESETGQGVHAPETVNNSIFHRRETLRLAWQRDGLLKVESERGKGPAVDTGGNSLIGGNREVTGYINGVISNVSAQSLSSGREQQLRKQIADLKMELEAEMRINECNICYRRRPHVVIFPCLHSQYCHECIEKQMRISAVCPTCRGQIVTVMPTR